MTTDLRVIKTKASIKEGFLACIDKQSFSKLTIRDLTSQMQINKSTFYTYYEDKFDLRSRLIADSLQVFANSIDVSYLKLTPAEIRKYELKLPNALTPLFTHRREFVTLWSVNLESNVFEQMETIFVKKFYEVLQTSPAGKQKPEYQELNARLFATSAMQVIKWWFEISPTTPVGQVAHIIASCLTSGTYVAFNSDDSETS